MLISLLSLFFLVLFQVSSNSPSPSIPPVCEEFDNLSPSRHFIVGDRVLVENCGRENNGRPGCKGTVMLVTLKNAVPTYLIRLDPQEQLDILTYNFNILSLPGSRKALAKGVDSLCSSSPNPLRCPCSNPVIRCDCSVATTEFLSGYRQLWLLKSKN